MRPHIQKPLGATLATLTILALGLGAQDGRGEEPRGLGRLFRFGNNSNASAPNRPEPKPTFPAPRSPAATPSLLGPSTPAPTTPPLMADVGAGPSAPEARIRPQPRVSHAATEADPLLTHVSLGRANDGKQFGMFLQVYSDGTVIDSEGVHKVKPDALKPLMDVLHSGELDHLQGHCGGPPANFIEQVYVTVYDRSLGRLRANSFSYSGNPQGCSHAVHQLQAAIEVLQTKMSGPVSTSAPEPAANPITTGVSAFGVTNAPPPPVIPLTNPN